MNDECAFSPLAQLVMSIGVVTSLLLVALWFVYMAKVIIDTVEEDRGKHRKTKAKKETE